MTTTIVLADDHRIVREGIRRILKSRDDFEVVGEAANGEEAVALVAEKNPDVVLMDITMPRLSGVDATRRICKAQKGTHVLVLSMHDDRTCVEEVLRAGASGYVVKDSAPAELISAIDAVRAGESYLSPSITHQVVNAIAQPGERPNSAASVLTDREREVLSLIAEGLSSKETPKTRRSLKTVESHRASLMEKPTSTKCRASCVSRFALARAP